MSSVKENDVQPLKLDNCNIILNVDSEEFGEMIVYIPQPNTIELKSISRVLAYFLNSYRKELGVDIIIIDYERYIEEALEVIDNPSQRELKQKQVSVFLERSLLGATFFDTEYNELDKNKLTEQDKEFFYGTLLFTSALFRYYGKKGQTYFNRDLFTSLSVTEWKEHCKKQLEQSTKPKKATSGKKEQKKEEKEVSQEETTLFVSVN